MTAGTKPGQPPLEVELSPITVFVGPNNSGKSRTLQEIERWARTAQPMSGLLVDRIEFEPWKSAAIEAAIADLEVVPNPMEISQPDHVLISKLSPQHNSPIRTQIHKPAVIQQATNPNRGARHQYAAFLSLFTLKLDGTNRLGLTGEQPSGDLQKSPGNHLAQLFQNNASRTRLRKTVFDAFGKHLVVDPTNMGKLRLRLSVREPTDETEERGWHEAAKQFHGAASPIEEASDGVRAFVGMLSILVAGDPKIVMIDEPEAFLAPPLSSRLGKELCAAMRDETRRLFVSTHSASFLMGCVQAGAAMNIIRLTYSDGAATARVLTREKLTPLMRNPLLRSVGVLEALFHTAVVVTEGDKDRAFYQEVNARLLAENDPRGIPGCLFLNAQNKQTVWDIVRPLRELGIPAAGVVDIDVLKDGGAEWMKPLKSAFIPEASHTSLQLARKSIYDVFKATTKDMKRDGGVALLAKPDQEACQNLFRQLAEYGVFVVESGELESWLSHLKVERNKRTWLVSMFERMGDDPTHADYVNPGAGDVWDFVGKISKWVGNSTRQGIPE
jgi:ABC-type cobalamin/Fe3+-siderophores transport system ATPase subunit